jgi:hypothetical protein
MFTEIVLSISHDKLIAGIWHWRRLQWHGEFNGDEPGRQQFSYFLRAHAGIPISLLLNAVEEDFRLEMLPHASGKVRRQLLERKLNQHYRNTRFRVASFIDRDLNKRRDDRYLFAALNSTTFLQGWLDDMTGQGALLKGVYLLPMLSAVWVRSLKLAIPHLLLSERLSSGLRQSYLQHGRLLFSRLIVEPHDRRIDDLKNYCAETEKTRLYLMSQQFIAHDTALEVLCTGEDGEQACRALKREQDLNCRNFDLAAMAHDTHIAPQLLSTSPELLHMHVLAGGARSGNLAPGAMVNDYRLSRVRRRIYALTAASAVTGLALSGLYLQQNLDLRTQLQQTLETTQQQEALYRQTRQVLPVAPLPGIEMGKVVQLHELISRYPKTPRRVMHVFGAALAQAPEIRIHRLRWVLSSNLVLDDKKGGAATSQQPGETGPIYEFGFVDGEIAEFAGDYDAARVSVMLLLERLRAQPDVVQAIVLQSPASASAAASLQGNTDAAGSLAPPAASFKLKLVLKRETA